MVGWSVGCFQAASSGILITHCYDITDVESSELAGATVVTVTDTITVSGPRILLWFAAKKAVTAQQVREGGREEGEYMCARMCVSYRLCARHVHIQMVLDHLKKSLENRTPI